MLANLLFEKADIGSLLVTYIMQRRVNLPISRTLLPVKPVESKPHTYYGWVGSCHTAHMAGRPGRVRQNWMPTELFAQGTRVL